MVLSNNLNTIGSMAFKDASLMEGVYIPASVSSIPENNQIFKGMANNSVIYLGSSDLISLMLQSKADPTSTSNGKRFVKGDFSIYKRNRYSVLLCHSLLRYKSNISLQFSHTREILLSIYLEGISNDSTIWTGFALLHLQIQLMQSGANISV